MEINVLDYLDEHQIKEICEDELRNQVRKHFSDEENAQRLLYNLSYKLVYDEIDKSIGKSSKDIIVDKTLKILKDIKSYSVFRNGDYGSAKSLGYNIMERAVKDNEELIRERVRQTLIDKDYSEDVWSKMEEVGENFMSNIYEITELVRNKKKDETI